MKKATIEAIEKIKDDDLILLSHLYLYRALDVEQAMKYIYKVDTDTSVGKRSRTVIRNRLNNLGLIKMTPYRPEQEAWQLTNKGINVVKYARDLPREVIDPETKSAKRGYYTATELSMNPRLLNHQIHLNQFMLDFGERAREINLPWNYYDEKFLSQYKGIRPDGMITLLNYDIFLEIDMASESKTQLMEKWQHYRQFLNSEEFKNKSRKIVVLFDVDGIKSAKKIKARSDLVKQTIVDTILDLLTDDFEIVIKPKSELINYVFESLIPRILNRNSTENNILRYLRDSSWTISYGYPLNQTLLGDFYNYFIRRLNKNGTISKHSGILQEYFIDFYLDEELSVLHRIEYYRRNNSLYKEKYGRDIRLIIVSDNLEQLYNDLKLLGRKILGQPNIFILDINNLNLKDELYSNLYTLGTEGEVYRITTRDHSRREFKYQIGKKEIIQKQGRVNKIKKITKKQEG